MISAGIDTHRLFFVPPWLVVEDGEVLADVTGPSPGTSLLGDSCLPTAPATLAAPAGFWLAASSLGAGQADESAISGTCGSGALLAVAGEVDALAELREAETEAGGDGGIDAADESGVDGVADGPVERLGSVRVVAAPCASFLRSYSALRVAQTLGSGTALAEGFDDSEAADSPQPI